jgi:hypothetical protein
VIGAPSRLRLIRKAAALARLSPHFSLEAELNFSNFNKKKEMEKKMISCDAPDPGPPESVRRLVESDTGGSSKVAGDRRRRGWAGGKWKRSRSQDVGGVREAALQ